MEAEFLSPEHRSESASTLVEPHSSSLKNIHNLTNEQLWDKLSVAEEKVHRYEDENIELRAQIAVYKDKEKEQKDQLATLSSLIISNGSHQKSVDLQRMYDQLLYKDKRLSELNNIILEKERQIMDLQEICRDQDQVAAAKKQAVQIVNRRLQEIDSKDKKDASTETDVVFMERSKGSSRKRIVSPGRAIPQLRLSGGNGSPPPLDPAEDHSSFTTETATYDDAEREWSPSPSAAHALNRISRKYRKKVTFDLKTSGKKDKVKREIPSPDPSKLPMQGIDGEVAQQIIDLTNENDELRRIISEIETAPLPEQQLRIEQLEEELENIRRNGKNQVLRARATAQARIKELEGRISELQASQTKEVDSLLATNEALKTGRDFILEENGKLLEKIEKLKEKVTDLRSELEGANELAIGYRRDFDGELRKSEEIRGKLKEANHAIQQANDEKQFAYNEAEKLKEAIFAQDELIQVLEGDLIVYETRVGLLQDSLGASKIEELQNIRAKAVTAKVNALEVEKQDVKKRNDEKLLIKGLHIKIKCLEEERSELLKRIQKHENHEFQPHSLEDLRRFDANRPPVYHSQPSIVNEHQVQLQQQQQSHNDIEQNNESSLKLQKELYELQQQLDTVTHEKEALEAELAAAKNSQNGMPNILGLLEAVEDIAMAPVYGDRIRSEEINTGLNAENLRRLEGENEELRKENINLTADLEQFREQLSEMEAVAEDANQVQNLLESQKATIQAECEELKEKLLKSEAALCVAQSKGNLSKNSEATWVSELEGLRKENASLVEAKQKLKQRIQAFKVQIEEIQAEKTLLENKIYGLEKQNIGLAESNERMSRFEVENNRLDHLVSNLRTQVEQFQVEAQLSRSCLEDMQRIVAKQTSSNAAASVGSIQRMPSIDEAMAMKTALEALNASLHPQMKNGQKAYQELYGAFPKEQQHFETIGTGEEQSDTSKYVQMSQANVHLSSQYHNQATAPISPENPVQYYPQQQQQQTSNPYVQSHFNNFGYQQQAPITTQAYLQQSSMMPEEQIDYEFQSYSETYPHQLQSTGSSPIDNGASHQLEEIINEYKALQAQYSELEKSYRELQLYYEKRERDLLEQKEHFENRASNLSNQLVKYEEKIEESFKENVDLENENCSKEDQIQTLQLIIKQQEEAKGKLTSNEEELCHIRKQMEHMDNEYNHLKDTNKRLDGFLGEARTSLGEAEEARNALANENRQLRETLENLQKALNDAQEDQRIDCEEQFLAGKAYEVTNGELEKENAQLRQQLSAALNNINDNTESVVNSTLRTLENNFDDSRPKTFEVETQCQIQGEEEYANANEAAAKIPEDHPPQFSDEMLKDYVKETNKFTDYLSQDVESLFVLNEELANAADSLKGQVWALNQQLKKSMLDRQEILEQIERLETENLNASNENIRLKHELTEHQGKLAAIEDQNEKWKNELSILYDKKAEVDAAYNQLAENYSQLQEAYNAVLQKLCIPKMDGSTDPLVESDLIDSAQAIKNEYANLEKVSSQMRAELEARSERIRNLEQQISQVISRPIEAVHHQQSSAAQHSSSASAVEEQARGEKATAHWTMLEIKKLLVEAADTLQRLPIDEAYEHVRREIEVKWSERVHNAIEFCENVIKEIQKCDDEGIESATKFSLPKDSDSVGIENVILRLHERWRLKHHQLLESSNCLQNQQQICRELESRLSDANEKLAELESQRSSTSPSEAEESGSSTPSISPSMQQFWERLIESFSQSSRACNSIDMKLSSTNSLIHNALKQLDSSSTDANKAMGSAKLQFAILAARLTAKQADNDALFRATTELAHTNLELQNQLDGLQEKIGVATENAESKHEEVDEVAIPETLPESNVSIDAAFKKTRQGAKTRSIIANKPKIRESVEASVVIPSRQESPPPQEESAQSDSWGWGDDEAESQQQETTHENANSWGWDEKEKTPSNIDENESSLTSSPIPATQEDQVSLVSEEMDLKKEATPSTDVFSNVEEWESKKTSESKNEPILPPKAAKKQIPKIVKEPTPESVEEETNEWNDQPFEEPSPKSREATPSQPPPDPPAKSEDNTEKLAKVFEWAWNDEPKRTPSRASSTTSKASTKKSATVTKKPPPSKAPTNDTWGWGDEEEEAATPVVKEEKPIKSKPKPKSSTAKSQPKCDDWGWGDEEEEREEKSNDASNDWGW